MKALVFSYGVICNHNIFFYFFYAYDLLVDDCVKLTLIKFA